MANIPGTGGTVLPGVYDEVVTESTGVSVPGGTRIAAIIGEGLRPEVIVSSAAGKGKDGLNPTYTSTNGSDGRHFKLSRFPIVSNRLQLFRNGIPLEGTEETITGSSFSKKYDYRVDINTGKIELQKARLVDQGGSFYIKGANTGTGTVSNITLLDANAPSENWTIKCISVTRNPSNTPLAGTAKFVAFGSVSGNILNSSGNPTVWVANGVVANNSVLSFSISDISASVVFKEGDYFTIVVKSGVLNKNDSLTANYIPVESINDPEFLESLQAISTKHGSASLDNNLTLGCQLAFANSTPGIMCLQAAPPIPRRTSYSITDSMQATSTDVNDFIFPLPKGVIPDSNSSIHFFVTDPVTTVENQLLPNRVDYYTLDLSNNGDVTTFVMDDTLPPSGTSFSYTVSLSDEVMATGFDGYFGRQPLNGLQAIFKSDNLVFLDDNDDSINDYIGKTLKVIDSINVANVGEFTITGVSNGYLSTSVTVFPDFVPEASLTFSFINPSTGNSVVVSGTDGYIDTVYGGTGTARFGSVLVDFSAIGSILNKRVKITGSTSNNGTYDVTAYNNLNNTVTLEKVFVTESNMRFEILDSLNQSAYLVLNHNIVPDENSLRITLVDQRDADFYDAGWLNALSVLETQEIDILVPLPKQTISAIIQNSLSHCLTMSQIKNRKERVLLTGAINGLAPENLTGAEPAAVEDIGILEGIQGETVADLLAGNTEDLTNYSVSDAFGTTFRCMYFYPDQIISQVGTENAVLDGFYMAAAAAGWFSGTSNVAMPLTNKVLAGFSILRNKQLSNTVMEQLAAAGVTVVQPVQGGGEVIWGLTTTQSGYPEEQEPSIVFIRDRIAKDLRAGFKAYIGLPESSTFNATLSARGISLLGSFISRGLITAYKGLVIERDAVDPRQWNVSVKVQPVYSVNWIYIKVGIGII